VSTRSKAKWAAIPTLFEHLRAAARESKTWCWVRFTHAKEGSLNAQDTRGSTAAVRFEVEPAADRRELRAIRHHRYEKGSTLIASQFPTNLWYKNLAAPTLADAILDRIPHNSHRVELKGESLRKVKRRVPTG
jgi:hypothetical protein